MSRQLEGLSADERRLTEAVAVLGRRVDFDVLSAVTGNDEAALIGHLRALSHSGLLVEDDEDEFGARAQGPRSARRWPASSSGGSDGACTSRPSPPCGPWAAVIPPRWPSTRRAPAATTRWSSWLAKSISSVHYRTCGSSFQVLRLAVEALAEAPDDHFLLEAAARAAWLLGTLDEAITHAERWYRLAEEQHGEGARRLPARSHVPRLVQAARPTASPRRRRGDAQNCRRAKSGRWGSPTSAQIHMLDRHPEERRRGPTRRWPKRGRRRFAARAQALVEKGSCRPPGGIAAWTRADLEAGIALAERLGEWVLVAAVSTTCSTRSAWPIPVGCPRRAHAPGSGVRRLRLHVLAVAPRLDGVACDLLGDRVAADQRANEFGALADGADTQHRRWTRWCELELQYEAGAVVGEPQWLKSPTFEHSHLALAYRIMATATERDRGPSIRFSSS